MAKNYFTEERHKLAKQMRAFYREETGDDRPYYEFLRKKENPIYEKINFYEVTFNLSHQGQDYNFKIEQETFLVAVPKSPETQMYLKENTKQQVADIFKGDAKNFVYNNLDVEVNEYTDVRGLEQKTNYDFEDIDFNQVVTSKKYIESTKVDVVKETKGGKGNKNDYNLNIWF